MLEVAREARASGETAGEAFATQIERDTEMERTAVDRFLDYAMFVARRQP
jgi:hypothetical protein